MLEYVIVGLVVAGAVGGITWSFMRIARGKGGSCEGCKGRRELANREGCTE